MIPSYLADLDLPAVFAAYTSTPCKYLQESVQDEHVVDSTSQGVSGFVSASFGQAENLAKKYFAVENPTAHPYALLQIDNGFIKSIGTKKCDCAIANDKDICFVEFKANATKDTPSALRTNYRKAMAQLSTTIDLFNAHYSSKGIDLKKLRKVEAYICFREGYPKSTSSQMNCKVRFMAQNGIPLSFERKKIL